MKMEVELNFPKQYKEEAFFCYVIKHFDVIVKIIEASFSTDTGWAILNLEGQEREMKRLFDFLKDKNIEVTHR